MPERERILDASGSRVVVLAVVNGLLAETERVRNAFDRHRPEAVGVAVNAAELEGLRRWNAGEKQEIEMSEFDMLYMKELSRFGEVLLPSPALLYSVALADTVSIPIYPLDMESESYSELYLRFISPTSLFFSSLFRRRKRKEIGGTLEEVVLELDRLAQRPSGMKLLDRERERHVASVIARSASEGRNMLAVVEFERSEGIVRELCEKYSYREGA